MSATELGLSGLVWGTIGDSEIILDNIRESMDGEWEELPDGQGDIVAAVAHGTYVELTMDFKIKDGSASSYLVSRGSEINVPASETDLGQGMTLYVQNHEKSKDKNDWMSGTLTARHYPDMS